MRFLRSTALMLAADAPSPDVVALLLRRGADVRAVGADCAGVTLYAISGAPASEPTLKLLLAAGAPLDPRDGQGMTALDWAEFYHHRRLIEVLRRAQHSARRAGKG